MADFQAKTVITGWRAFSNAFQEDTITPYTTASGFTSYNFEGKPSSVIPNNRWKNTDEITGARGPTQSRNLNFIMADNDHVQKANSDNVAMLAALVCGRITSSGTGTSVHTITPPMPEDSIILPTRTMVEFDGDRRERFTGVGAKSLQLEGPRDDFVKLTATLFGNGEMVEDTGGIFETRPSQVLLDYLTYANANIELGGGDVLNPKVQTWTLGVNNNAQGIAEHGDDTQNITRFESQELEVTLSMVLELNTREHYTQMRNGTQLALNMLLDGGATNQVELDFPILEIAKVEKDTDGKKLIANVEFDVLANSATGAWFSIICRNSQPSYS